MNQIPENPPHPGELIKELYLKPLGLTQYRFAKCLGISQTRLSEILEGHRSITADTALRLGIFLSIEPDFWMHAQAQWDLAQKKEKIQDELNKIKPYSPEAF